MEPDVAAAAAVLPDFRMPGSPAAGDAAAAAAARTLGGSSAAAAAELPSGELLPAWLSRSV